MASVCTLYVYCHFQSHSVQLVRILAAIYFMYVICKVHLICTTLGVEPIAKYVENYMNVHALRRTKNRFY